MSDASEPAAEVAEAAPEAAEVLDIEVPDTPVLDDAAPDTPVLDDATEALEGEEPEAAEIPDDPFHEFGGRETIEAAHRMYEASRTEDGVIQLFIEAGRSLGLGLKEMEALFSDAAPADAPAAEEPEFDPEEPLTLGQWQEIQRKQAEEAAAKQHEAAVTTARATVAQVTTELGLDPKDPAYSIVLGLGDKHLKDDLSPENVAAAVRQGHAEYLALVEKESKRYLQTKQAKATSVPSAPAGAAAPVEPAGPEPQNTAEAIKLARRKLGLSRS